MDIGRDLGVQQLRLRALEHTRKAFALLPAIDRPRILDIGCGRGLQTMELARLSGGDFFGEVSLVKNKPRTATIIALEDSELMELSRDAFQAVASDHPEIGKAVEETIEKRVEDTIKKMIDG